MKTPTRSKHSLAHYQKTLSLKEHVNTIERRQYEEHNNDDRGRQVTSRIISHHQDTIVESEETPVDHTKEETPRTRPVVLSTSKSDSGVIYHRPNSLENDQLQEFEHKMADYEPCVELQVENSPEESPLAQPPSGYFIRDELSNDSTKDSGFQPEKESFSGAEEEEILTCTFGCKDKDKEAKMPVYFSSNDKIMSSASPTPRRKKARSKSKDLPKKKVKKVKIRKSSKNKHLEFKDQSPKTKPDSVSSTKAKSKYNVDLKRGIALKQVSKKGKNQPLRYQQKVMHPDNSNFFERMGSLPVSIDSVLYYYEPQGKPGARKSKRNPSQTRKSAKVKKNKCNNGCEQQNSGNILWKQTSDEKKKVLLNTNVNANTSDIDLTVPEDVNNPKIISFNEIVGVTSSLQDSVGDASTNDSLMYSDALDSTLKLMALQDNAPTKMTPSNASTVGKEVDSSLDLMVDEFIQSAFKEEEEYERRLMQDAPNKTTKEKEKNTKPGSFVLNVEHRSMSAKKPPTKDDDNARGPERPGFKSLTSRPDKTCKESSRTSSSSPNISVIGKTVPTHGGEVKHYVESLPRSKSQPHTEKLIYGHTERRTSQDSPQLLPAAKSYSKRSNSQNDTIKGAGYGSGVGECDLKESLQKKERGRPTKSQEIPSGSILRKSSSGPQGEKRTQSQPSNKCQGKRKSSSDLKKSQSMSPAPVKVSNGSSRQGHTGGLRKKTQKLAKKNKKKVRIVVDWHGFQSDKLRKTAVEKPDSCEEKNSKSFSDEEGGSCCELEDDVEIETREPRTEENYDESEQSVENELEKWQASEGEKEQLNTEQPPYHIVCGFSECTSEHESPASSPKGSNKIVGIKKHTKKGTKIKKTKKPKEADKKNTETGWISSPRTIQEESKTKLVVKKKRYQLKKMNTFQPDKKITKNTAKDHVENDHAEEREQIASSVDDEKQFPKKRGSSPRNAKGLIPAQIIKPSQSPKGLRKKFVPIEVDPDEGSSVDAPAFNARRESKIRISKSGPLINTGKPVTKDTVSNTPVSRVKSARDNFSKFGRQFGRPATQLSPSREEPSSNQVSPIVSRSTDLDVALGFKRQQSPMRLTKLNRRDSKLSQSKPRAKTETEGVKEDIAEDCFNESPHRRIDNFTDPMEMNVLNLGLSWMVQGFLSRLSYFNPKTETAQEVPASPVAQNSPSARSGSQPL